MGGTGITPAAVADWAATLGFWGPLIIGSLIALESLVAPIPGWFLVVAAGLLYGFWAGLALSWVSACLGAFCAYTLARKYGHNFLFQRIPPHIATRLAGATDKNGFVILLIARVIPFTALDILSYAAGLSGMRLAPFAAATALGLLPGTAGLVALGDQAMVIKRIDLMLYALTVVVIGAWLVYWLIRSHRAHRSRLS